MCNQTIIPPEKLAGTIFCDIPFGYTKLENHHLDKLNELNNPSGNVLYVLEGCICVASGNGYFDKSLPPYFMLTADFNRFFGVCEKESVSMDNQDKQVLVMFDEPISNLHSMGKVLGARLEPNFWNLGEYAPAIFVLIEKVDGKVEFYCTPICKGSRYGEELLPHIEKKFPRPVRENNMTVDELIEFYETVRDWEVLGFSVKYSIEKSLKSMGLKAKD